MKRKIVVYLYIAFLVSLLFIGFYTHFYPVERTTEINQITTSKNITLTASDFNRQSSDSLKRFYNAKDCDFFDKIPATYGFSYYYQKSFIDDSILMSITGEIDDIYWEQFHYIISIKDQKKSFDRKKKIVSMANLLILNEDVVDITEQLQHHRKNFGVFIALIKKVSKDDENRYYTGDLIAFYLYR